MSLFLKFYCFLSYEGDPNLGSMPMSYWSEHQVQVCFQEATIRSNTKDTDSTSLSHRCLNHSISIYVQMLSTLCANVVNFLFRETFALAFSLEESTWKHIHSLSNWGFIHTTLSTKQADIQANKIIDFKKVFIYLRDGSHLLPHSLIAYNGQHWVGAKAGGWDSLQVFLVGSQNPVIWGIIATS